MKNDNERLGQTSAEHHTPGFMHATKVVGRSFKGQNLSHKKYEKYLLNSTSHVNIGYFFFMSHVADDALLSMKNNILRLTQ